MRKKISIITPCYNEEQNVNECYRAIKNIFSTNLIDYDYEHIFCDNASMDNTLGVLKELARQDKRLKIIANARNFGPFRSMFNGLINTNGDAVLVCLPADLQDPPELMVEFIKMWEKGHQIVYGVRKKREEFFIMSFMRRLFYWMVNKFADFPVPLNAGEFQLIDKCVVSVLKNYDDYYPYIRGMIASCGFKSTGIEYVWRPRKKGKSRNKIYNLIDQGLNGIISCTNVPLRLCMIFGFILAGLSIFYAFIQLVINIIYFRELSPPGIATLIVAMFFFAGVQMFFIGFLGEYVGAIHFQVRKRPLVIEKERVNFD